MKKLTLKQQEKRNKIKTILKWVFIGLGWSLLAFGFVSLLVVGIRGCSSKKQVKANAITTPVEPVMRVNAQNFEYQDGLYHFYTDGYESWLYDEYFDYRIEAVGEFYTIDGHYGTSFEAVVQLYPGYTDGARWNIYLDGQQVNNPYQEVLFLNAVGDNSGYFSDFVRDYSSMLGGQDGVDFIMYPDDILKSTTGINIQQIVANYFKYNIVSQWGFDRGIVLTSNGLNYGPKSQFTINGVVQSDATITQHFIASATSSLIRVKNAMSGKWLYYENLNVEFTRNIVEGVNTYYVSSIYLTSPYATDLEIARGTLNNPSSATLEYTYLGSLCKQLEVVWNDGGINTNIANWGEYSLTDDIGDSSGALDKVFTAIANAFSVFASWFSIQVFPGITIGLLILFPLSFCLILFLIKVIKRG